MNIVVLLTLIILTCRSDGAKILGIFHMPAPSHFFLGSALMRGLADKGHDVTIVGAFKDDSPTKSGSYRSIQLTGMTEEMEGKETFLKISRKLQEHVIEHKKKIDLSGNERGIFTGLIGVDQMGSHFCRLALKHPNFQNLLNSGKKFDAVIVEQFLNEPMKAVAHHFDAPLIVLSTVRTNTWTNLWTANPAPLSYVPELLVKFPGNMDFFQRLKNCFAYLFHYLYIRLYSLPRDKATAKEFFPNSPDLEEILYNTSLVLANSHPSINQPLPSVPSIIDIGGYHIKPPKKLPQDLQQFLDNATEGVVYFSLGSNMKSTQLPPKLREAFINNFRKLKENVLWKWEDDTLPNQPPNLKILKWAPQQDILAHPNVKLFMTHGGLLSTTETVYHGVPILALPIFGDQDVNAQNAEDCGFGKKLRLSQVNEQNLAVKLDEVLNNPTFAKMAKRRSKIFHDREIKPLDRATYWVEYVIRHQGAPHLKVEGVNLYWYQYHLLDVLAFVVFTTIVVVKILCFLLRGLCSKRTSTQSGQEKKIKKN